MKWLTRDWWEFLLERPARGVSWWTALWCRMHGHAPGEVFYNVGGLEPDHSCRGCGDDLG